MSALLSREAATALPLAFEPQHPLRALQPLPAREFAEVRRRTVLEGYKWDPQVGDVSALAAFPLVMRAATWQRIATYAEALAAEAVQAEAEVLARPELLQVLGLPRALRHVLAGNEPLTPAAGRVVRFDFHWTRQGFRISEANSDVPGGFSEGSYFTARLAERFPELSPAGDPGAAWSRALVEGTGPGARFALLSAPGYLEDHQVVSYLAARLREHGAQAFLAKPEQLRWRNGVAHLRTHDRELPIDTIVRFYQAEWLSRTKGAPRWQRLFRGGKTRVANSAPAVISESKRFPLVWDRLATALPTWRALLPHTCDPRHVGWSARGDWVLKAAFCNTGDAVIVSEQRSAWRKARFWASLTPSEWVLQRRFESVPVLTPLGPRHVCVGVYTVNGVAAGAYCRLSPHPVIDCSAVDVALLIEEDSP